MRLFVVEWSQDWAEPIAVHRWEDWTKIPVETRTFFCETTEARDEIDAFMQALHGEIEIRS